MNKKTIFSKVLGDTWEKLPSILRRRYANRSHTQDEVAVEGLLNVHLSRWMKFWLPLLRLFGALVPQEGKNIPVRVCFTSFDNSNHLNFHRTFRFPDKGDVVFQSLWIPRSGDEVVEQMRFGMVWRMRFIFADDKIQLCHRGYAWHVGKWYIPLPLTWILGRAYAYEKAVSDDSFDMYFELIHPWWGKVFGYDGHFHAIEVKQS